MPTRTRTIEVTCTECPFSATVTPADDRLPAEYVVDHGKETGHKLQTNRVPAESARQ